MKTALVHDWLTAMRGGEKVLEVLCELLPSSDLYTMVYVPGRTTSRIEDRRIVPSWLNRLPGVGRYYRYLLPLMPAAASGISIRGYDLVVAISHCVAHGVKVAPGSRFVCYCNTPMRYAWDTANSYSVGRWGGDPRYWALRRLRRHLQAWDRRASTRVDEYISNSQNVRRRVLRCYGKDSAVIYPPVDTDFYHPAKVSVGDFYLWVGALAPYKRIDLALEAFRRLGRKLVVIGEGQDLAWARRTAPGNVELLGRQPDEVLRRYYRTCRALVFPSEEDFGIVPLEVQACGRPVIAYGKGGGLETVVGLDTAGTTGRPTGVFFDQPTAQSLVEAVLLFESHEHAFDPDVIRVQALRFSRTRCRQDLERYLFNGRQEARSS